MFGGLTNGGSNGDAGSKASPVRKNSSSDDGSAAKKLPPPKPPLPREDSKEMLVAPKTEAPKKPDWLEELSRKQNIRKSGLFKDKSEDKEEKEEDTSATSPTGEPKPQVPLKPSQIKDEGKALLICHEEAKVPIMFLIPARRSGIFSSFNKQQPQQQPRPTNLETSPAAIPSSVTSPTSESSPSVSSVVRAEEDKTEVVLRNKAGSKENVLDLEGLSLIERVSWRKISFEKSNLK